jgi:LacI family transcriptional regulator
LDFMITQKDIAKRLGISTSLVSRALTGTAIDIGVSEETVKRIREEAARLNYHPSAAALTLRGAPTKTLGVIVKDFGDPFFGHMLEELQSLAWAKQYSLLVTGCVPEHRQHVDLTSLLKYQLDGVIIAGSFFEPDGLDAFLLKGVPVVQIGCGNPRKNIVRLFMDEEFGLAQLIGYLKKLGHSEIGYVGADSPAKLRREDMLRAILKREGLAVRPDAFVRVAGDDLDAGYRAMKELLRRCNGLLPTAVIAADDLIAQTALRALFEHRVRVPERMSLVGVDDIPSARMTIPSLTTIHQPIREMIQQAFDRLTKRGKRLTSRGVREIVVKPQLIIRESCAVSSKGA